MGIIRLMGLDDVAIGVCLTGCVWFAGKPEGAQMGFCAPCRYSDQGALLLVMVLSDFRIQRSAPSGAVAGRFMELRGAYSRSGGGMKRVLPAKVEEGLQCAVGWLLGSGVGGE